MSATTDAPSSRSTTDVLNRAGRGDAQALEQAAELWLGTLRSLAGRQVGGDQQLWATDVADEAFLRMFRQEAASWDSREHFVSQAVRVVRCVVVDRLRRQAAQSRGGEKERVSLLAAAGVVVADRDPSEVLDLLDRMAAFAPEDALVCELRLLGGFSLVEVAEVSGLSLRSVHRKWAAGRAWLAHVLSS